MLGTTTGSGQVSNVCHEQSIYDKLSRATLAGYVPAKQMSACEDNVTRDGEQDSLQLLVNGGCFASMRVILTCWQSHHVCHHGAPNMLELFIVH